MPTAWDYLLAKSTAPDGSTAWEHLISALPDTGSGDQVVVETIIEALNPFVNVNVGAVEVFVDVASPQVLAQVPKIDVDVNVQTGVMT